MMTKKLVTLIVLNDFRNDSRVLKEAKSLLTNGYDARVLALHDSGLKEYESISGVPIRRVKLITKNLPKNYVFQFFKYVEFLTRAALDCRSSDIVHCNDLDALPVGCVIKFFLNRTIKIVYDAHELETEVNSLRGIAKRIAKFLERKLIFYADAVITVSDSIANQYVKNYSIEKPELVLNCPTYSNRPKQDRFREFFGIRKDQLIFLYQGALGPSRGIELLIDSFIKLQNKDVVLIFMGFGEYRSLIMQKALLHPNIFFHEAVPPDVLLEYTSSADYGISFTEDSCLNNRYCLPNKVFEYLMAGIPLLVSNLVELRQLVEFNSIGIVAEENTVGGFMEAIKKAAEYDLNIFAKNLIASKRRFNWESQEKVLLNLYSRL
jgi:glycosyltransferase involved in cell wall biosynthesis